MSHEIIAREDALPAMPSETQDAKGILALAVERGIDPSSIQKLVELVWKQEERNAAREFADALREFRRRCPPIARSKPGGRTKSGSVAYYYAPLDTIAAKVDPILDSLGLCYSWDSKTEGSMMTTTCVLRHINGHRETASFTCPATEGTGIMSGAQKAASAWSFARRQTLTAILGITTADKDTDGNDPTTISDEQAATIEDMLTAAGADRERFLAFAGVSDVPDILVGEYDRMVAAIKRKSR